MGGIIGKFSFDPHEPLARPVFEQMLDALRRRHASRDIFAAPGIALGVAGDPARTEIAAQELPSLRVAADSAITNALALRRELTAKGHTFATDTDSELILRAYTAWGTGLFARLRGPFACAIWDGATRRLMLARDHVGIRRLYFALLPNHGVVFATELRALLRDPGVPRDWCAEAIDAYLALGYVPAPLSAYRRVSTLEAASVLTIQGHSFQLEAYWDVPTPASVSAAEAADRVGSALARVVQDHERDERPWTMLGGASSRWAMQAINPRAMARRLAAHSDEPIADPAAVSRLAACLSARSIAEVALAGTGARTLWGPPRSQPHGFGDDHERRALYTRAFAWDVRHARPCARHEQLAAAWRSTRPAERGLYVDVHTQLPDSEIATAECAAAIAGLELRHPLLDRDLVALAALVPAPVKHRARGACPMQAALARAGLQDLLPAMDEPAHPWLDAALYELVPGVLLSPRCDGRGVVSRLRLRQLWDEHRRGACHGHRLWALLMLEFWFRESIDGDAVAEPFEYAGRAA